MQRGAISQEDARRVKDHVRDRLYDVSLRRMPEEPRIMCETGSTMRCAARISLLRSFLNKYLLRKCMNIAASPE